MDRSWYTRFALVVGLVLLGIYYAAPSVIYFMSSPDVRRSRDALQERIPDWLPQTRLNLGIDLQGGLHMVMGVDTDKAIQDRADRVGDEIVESMKQADTALEGVYRPDDTPELEIAMASADDWPQLKEVLDAWQGAWEVRARNGRTVYFGMEQQFETQMRDDAISQAQETLRNRIDAYGVAEPEIRRRQGTNSITIQLAGLTAEAIGDVKEDIIGRTAQLEFKIVDETNPYFTSIANDPDKPSTISVQVDQWRDANDTLVQRPYLVATDREDLRAFLETHRRELPADRVVGVQEFKANATAEPEWHTWLLERRTPLTGDSLTDAGVAFDSEQNQYYVTMNFDQRGGAIFARLTSNNVKRKMAIVLDDVVDSAPVIEGPIPNGRASIRLGGFKSQQEVLADAKALSLVLRAGALPAPVFPQEERTVGATLGDDAVAKGKIALTVALLAIGLLILVYYRASGVIAIVALTVNLILLFAALSFTGATLTLPGIAGLALTAGMAVDANIIQFERIREELRAGKAPRIAVDAGFSKAFSAIVDANVTTIIAAVILWQYGSGPIRGFGTTLFLGVLINTFTAVVVPRLAYEYLLRGLRWEKVSI